MTVREKKLRAELAHERRVSAVLREVGLAIGSVVNLDQILELILAKITDVVEAERATLYLLDEHRQELVSRVVVGQAVQTIRVPVGQGLAGVAARTGRPVRVADAYRDKRFLRDWDDLTGFRTRSILAVPMKNHVGWVMGVVQALNKRGGPFTREDEELLLTLATQAAVTIDNSRLYLAAIQKNAELSHTKDQLERKVRELDLLFKLESAMGRAATLNDLFRAALEQATEACDARAGAVLLPDDLLGPEPGPPRTNGASRHATIYFYDSEVPGRVKTILVHPAEGFIGGVYSGGRAKTARELEHSTEGARKLDEALGFETTSAVGAPLEGKDGPIGALALYNKDGGQPFGEGDLYLLRLLAANVSTAVQLHRSRILQERTERLTTIGQLLSAVMHDLKTPLAVVWGYVQMMSKASDPSARSDYAERIHKQFELIRAMQQEVLEFARGERTLWRRKVFLESFLKNLAQPLAAELEGSPIDLDLQIQDRGVARLDESKITRALNNLIRNALEAMQGQPGTLGLRVGRRGEEVVFSVSDSGPGIPASIRGRLFESFVTSGKKHGTGLGLAVVKQAAEEHGGRVEVESSPHGTTFHLVLPQNPP
jgi:signal transduction histidine kinase/putative methionine-R-sulfoxide reductase with GAF domain